MAVSLGIEQFADSNFAPLEGKKFGLLCHASSVDKTLNHTADLLRESSVGKLTTLFSPQQGFYGEDQDNMVETGHGEWKGIPLYSLYSNTRKPTSEMLQNVDAVVVDLPDVGTRIYTFIYTMSYIMEACAKLGKEVIVLDRPNPIGGELIQGMTLETKFRSFVGLYPMPTRHGMTIGEIAQWMNDCHELCGEGKCALTVIPMKGWARKMYWEQTGHTFIMPSANLPTPDTALTFPGTVYFEGTHLSEGRGTCRPLEQVGAPYIKADQLIQYLNQEYPAWRRGCVGRPTAFRPTFQKWMGKYCQGVFIHPIDRQTFNPVVTGLCLMRGIYELYATQFEWKKPPYEYESTKTPIDVISGTEWIRTWVEGRDPWNSLLDKEKQDTEAFRKERKDFLLY